MHVCTCEAACWLSFNHEFLTIKLQCRLCTQLVMYVVFAIYHFVTACGIDRVSIIVYVGCDEVSMYWLWAMYKWSRPWYLKSKEDGSRTSKPTGRPKTTRDNTLLKERLRMGEHFAQWLLGQEQDLTHKYARCFNLWLFYASTYGCFIFSNKL